MLLAAASGSNYKSYDDMFKMNCHIVKDYAKEFSKYCPGVSIVNWKDSIKIQKYDINR